MKRLLNVGTPVTQQLNELGLVKCCGEVGIVNPRISTLFMFEDKKGDIRVAWVNKYDHLILEFTYDSGKSSKNRISFTDARNIILNSRGEYFFRHFAIKDNASKPMSEIIALLAQDSFMVQSAELCGGLAGEMNDNPLTPLYFPLVPAHPKWESYGIETYGDLRVKIRRMLSVSIKKKTVTAAYYLTVDSESKDFFKKLSVVYENFEWESYGKFLSRHDSEIKGWLKEVVGQ